MKLIELAGLTKRFGPIVALSGVDAAIEGKIIGLLGPNGAGKSTRLKCLLGLVPFEGRAEVLEISAATHGAEIRDRVGYMPEQEALALLEAVSGRSLRVTYGPPQTGDMPRTRADTSRIERELGWRAGTPLRDGLAQHWQWASDRVTSR